MNLRVKTLNLKIGNTGYHQVNDEGEVYNVLPADYTGIINSVLQRHGGEIKMSRLVGELLGLELKGCSTQFVEKLIINVYGRDFERPQEFFQERNITARFMPLTERNGDMGYSWLLDAVKLLLDNDLNSHRSIP